jgi:serine/threonine protein kinase
VIQPQVSDHAWLYSLKTISYKKGSKLDPKRLAQEIQLLSEAKHPNVVKLFNVFFDTKAQSISELLP